MFFGDILRKLFKKKNSWLLIFYFFFCFFKISEVEINNVSISPFDEDINIDNKIKRDREDHNTIDEVENK
jgi:hypothetical protein